MNRKHPAALAALIVTAGLTSCAGSGLEQDKTNDYLMEDTITLQDGRTIHCVIFAAGYKGGVSCDWGGAQR